MLHTSERDLLEGAKSLDPAILGAVYDKYSPGIFRYAMRLLGDETYAEECVSETFSRFLKVLSLGQGPNEHLQAYLYRIAHNWITDSYRKNGPVLVELDDSFPSEDSDHPEEKAEVNLQKLEVRQALQCLTPEQRQVITLRFIEGWDNKEVAAAVGKPVSAVKTLQHRGLGALRRILEQGNGKKIDGSHGKK